MKYRLLIILAALAIVSCGKENTSDPSAETHTYVLSQKRSPKRGVAQNSWALPKEDLALLGPAMSWTYNWSSTALSDAFSAALKANSVDYCPMAWNANYNETGLTAANEWILGFNEPNLTDQCNMTPSQAAEHWPKLVAIAKASGKKLVSPAMNYGTLEGYHDPIKWLDDFFTQPGCSLDDIDAIAIHCYMPSSGAVKNFIELFRKYGKPIWLTEFCNGNSNNISEAAQMDYMSNTLNMLEQNDLVERYAWFMGRSGSFNSKWHNSLLQASQPYDLTDLGKVFLNISTFDDSIVYEKGDVIPAEQYCYADGLFSLAPSTDGGILDVTAFKKNCEVRYHLNMPSAGSYTLKLRFQTFMESSISVGFEGTMKTLTLQNTEHEWKTGSVKLDLPAGKSDLVIKGDSAAAIMLNWMIIE